METKHAMALRHVTEGRRIVDRQRALVARQRQAGHDTWAAERLLAQFEEILAIFESHLREIEAAGTVTGPFNLTGPF